MKVLWINNIAIPQILNHIGEKSVPVGGWMVKLADEISSVDGIELKIMFPYNKNIQGKVNKISYSGFVFKEKDINNLDILTNLENEIINFKPDVIHIFGTEYLHSYKIVDICEKNNLLNRVVVSIQGLISIISRHYTAFLDERVVKKYTMRDLMKGNINTARLRLSKKGELEIETIKKVKYIIGRTDWDKAVTELINPTARYYKNNEMLRAEFYRNEWKLDKCKRHRIFFSQATSPLKGLHLMIEALELIKKNYPDTTLYISGKSYSEKKKYKLSYYEKYILNMIKDKGLTDSVFFTGFLDEKEMCKQYLNSHVFVLASSIENSPNSLCEAMLLGVPSVSSMVGGVGNFIQHKRDGFIYQADAPYMLSYYIQQIFGDDKISNWFSENAKKAAKERHDINNIIKEIIDIYLDIKGYNS